MLSGSNGIRTHNHLVRKRTLNHLAKLSFRPVWVLVYELGGCGFNSRFCHVNFRYGACWKQARSKEFLDRQTIECRFNLQLVCDRIITYSHAYYCLLLLKMLFIVNLFLRFFWNCKWWQKFKKWVEVVVLDFQKKFLLCPK